MDKLRELFGKYIKICSTIYGARIYGYNKFEEALTDEYHLLNKKETKIKKFSSYTVYQVKNPEIKDAEGQETRKCRDCGRVGYWMTTDDPKYIQCKCGNEEDI